MEMSAWPNLQLDADNDVVRMFLSHKTNKIEQILKNKSFNSKSG